MHLISAHSGKLQTLETAGLKASPERAFTTGLAALDAVAPKQSWARGAVHELLFDPRDGQSRFVAALIAGAASEVLLPLPCRERVGVRVEECGLERGSAVEAVELEKLKRREVFAPLPSPQPSPCKGEGVMPIIWSDLCGELYPPALASLGFDLSKLYLLRPASLADEIWAVTESLRCAGVGAVIMGPERLSRIETRRLQLAAETGGSVGIFLRPRGRGDSIYAAATRWLVAPYPGERSVQRWTIQLLHGHGGRIGQIVFVEWCRETNSVRAVEKLADRPAETTAPPRVPLRATG